MNDSPAIHSYLFLAALAGVIALSPGNGMADEADFTEFGIHPDESVVYRAYEGTIGGRIPIRVFLCHREGSWEGSYYYSDHRLPLGLFDKVLGDVTRTRNKKVVFSEAPLIETGGATGRWEGVFGDDFRTFEGTWHSMDGKTVRPIKLKESHAGGMLSAVFYGVSSSWSQSNGSAEALRRHSATVVQFDGDDPAIRRINAAIRAAATQVFATKSLVDAVTALRAAEEAVSREGRPFAALEAAIRVKPIDSEEIQYGAIGHDLHDLTIYPVHNEGGFVSVRLYLHEFTGGAHGNRTDFHLTFETATGRLLDLRRDILKPGYEKPLARAAEAALRRKSGLKPGAPLTEGPLDTDTVELNENWFFTVGGIGFSHDPYDLAPFLIGFVDYLIPWKDLKPWLREGALLPRAIP